MPVTDDQITALIEPTESLVGKIQPLRDQVGNLEANWPRPSATMTAS